MVISYKVYVHINKINGKLYIGQTSEDDLSRRFGKNGQYYHNSSYFYHAIQKYGWDNFEHILLIDNLDLEMANIIEEELIKKYKSNDHHFGYNLKSGGHNSNHSQRTKDKISKAHVGKFTGSMNGRSKRICQYDIKTKKLIKTYESIREASFIFGSTTTISGCCNGLFNQAYGCVWAFEGEKPKFEFKDKRNNKAKRVIQKTLNGEVINIYRSTIDAEKSTGIDRSRICRCCNGKQSVAGDYFWEYEKEVV